MVEKLIERLDRHKDGSIKAKGYIIDDMLTGYWEWFRKDCTKMRSGHFENGKQAGPLPSPHKAKAPPGDGRGSLFKIEQGGDVAPPR